MVFPSLVFNVEPGLISQVSAFTVLAFSFVLHRFKKIMLGLVLAFAILIALQSTVFAFMAMPTNTQQNCPGYALCYNNQNYYGQPYGYRPSVYFYPQLQFHSLWGAQPFYFRPHNPSPYGPYDCPACNQYWQQQQQGMPMPYIHANGAAS